METSPLSKLAALGLGAVLMLALMYLFTLNQVTDSGASETAAYVDEALARNLAPGGGTRVTVVRDGTGVDAPRRYVVRYHPSGPVAADPVALDRLALRIANLVATRVTGKAPLRVHCVAALPQGGDAQACFERVGGEDAWNLEPVVPVPPLPAPDEGETGGETGGEESSR